MNDSVTRRDFLRQTSVLTGGLAALGGTFSVGAAQSPNEKVVVAIIGCNARGLAHIAGYLPLANAEIGYVCDVDSRAIAKGLAAVAKKQKKEAKGVKDFRSILENKDLDAISIATPDHWHAPATILGCAAGKHVYVEKPGSHDLRESDLMVAAARKYKRVVQMGNQRRSWPWVQESIRAVREGEIGKVNLARGWYTAHRQSIGHGKQVPVPDWLDYSLWQGPAPEKPYQSNVIHYNWHWFWNWGTGEIGNNGVHMLDLARWGLDVDLPQRVTCGGKRYFFEDDWETPDTIIANFDFGNKGILWECHSCTPRGFEGSNVGVNFYGEKGCVAISGNDTTIYDLSNKVLREINSKQDGLFAYDSVHFANFLDAIRENKPLRSEIEEGQKSTVLCHLGNIAWRTGHTLTYDPKGHKIVDDPAAEALYGRTYRPGWEPKV
jgi:predicted dehydrogenase